MNTWFFVGVIAVLTLSACSAPDNHANNPNNVQADQLVLLSPDAFGCEDESIFVDAADHYSRQEFAAWASEVRPENGCFSELSGKLVWTVMQVRGPLLQVGFATLAQYEAAEGKFGSDAATKHYWTLASWAVPAPVQ